MIDLKTILIFLASLVSAGAEARQIRVALLDSGVNIAQLPKAVLCKTGHMDLTNEGNPFNDYITHGTDMLHEIQMAAGDANYCVIVVKIIFREGSTSSAYTTRALNLLSRMNIDILNVSMEGHEYDLREKLALDRLMRSGTVVVAAAGNHGNYLSKDVCQVFPACYSPKVVVVSNENTPEASFGPRVDLWEYTSDPMLATSGATAKATGKLIKLVDKTLKMR